MKEAMRDLRQYVRRVTCELPEDEYIEFMRELGVWATGEAELAEYELTADSYDE
jgi:hypothetical protein